MQLIVPVFRPQFISLIFSLFVGAILTSASPGWTQSEEITTQQDSTIVDRKVIDLAKRISKPGPTDELLESDYSTLRDPFKPLNLSAKSTPNPLASPLETYALSQLQFKAVIRGVGVLKGLVEDEQGRGFYVSVGSRIGKYQGVVQDISEKKITVKETQIKFTGEKLETVSELYLKKG